MASKRALERRLATLSSFTAPDDALEQYTTPPELAAHLVHRADLDGAIRDRTVIDLGAGTGILALGAATRHPARVIGLERDPKAIAIARDNERSLDPSVPIDWLLADAGTAPVCVDDTTVIMNPPFGAHRDHTHADRRFLETTARIASSSYSIHNAGSTAFVEAFASDHHGTVVHAFAGTFALPRQFNHHTADTTSIDVEVYRIDWAHPD